MDEIISLRRTARTAGFLYLLFLITYVFSVTARSSLVVSGEPAITANNIMASEWLFRISFASEIFSAVFFLLAAWGLYILLKSVNKDLALLFLLLNLAGVAVQCIDLLNLMAALTLSNGTEYLQIFKEDERHALAMFFLNLYRDGFIIAMIFYGAWLFPLGYLVFKSRFLPRILGMLLMADGFCVVVYFFKFLFFPNLRTLDYFLFPVMFIAEVSLCIWLLIKGVKVQKQA